MPSAPDTNKQTVLAFYDALVNKKDFNLARTFVGPRYIQHNPLWEDGFAGLQALVAMLKSDFSSARSDVKRCFADGDHVILHVHSIRVPGSAGRAIVDIFRLENGLIAEHWDVIQEVPPTSANRNGMFGETHEHAT